MYKFQTKLKNFRIETKISLTTFVVMWFVYDEDHETRRCFSKEESEVFQNFILQNRFNFPVPGENDQRFSDCSDEPSLCDITLNPEETIYPNLILSNHPVEETWEEDDDSIDVAIDNEHITLTDVHHRPIICDLPFSVIGIVLHVG